MPEVLQVFALGLVVAHVFSRLRFEFTLLSNPCVRIFRNDENTTEIISVGVFGRVHEMLPQDHLTAFLNLTNERKSSLLSRYWHDRFTDRRRLGKAIPNNHMTAGMDAWKRLQRTLLVTTALAAAAFAM